MKEKPIEDYKLKMKDLSRELPLGSKEVKCPSCSNETPGVNINIIDKVGKCDHCNIIFSLEKEVADIHTTTLKQEVIKPEGIDLFYFQDDLDITVRQPLTGVDLFSIIFIPLIAIGLTLAYVNVGLPLMWPLLFWFLSGWSLINLLSRNKHKIYLTIDDQNMEVKWRPKKLMRDKIYPVHEIDQIYAKRFPSGGSGLYMIVNGDNGQKHVPLIRGLESLSKARFLEQEIEKHLQIKDREIPEEG